MKFTVDENYFLMPTGFNLVGRVRLVGVNTVEKLPRILRPISDEQGANAAVALLLRPKGGDLEVLLVRRVENPSDPWSGQMALPGGKRDSADVNLPQTVARETLEETGIKLDHCRFLGVMTALRSEPRPRIKVLPFVVLLESEPQIRLNKKELESFIWVPYEEIVRSKGTAEFSFGKVPAYLLECGIVWGVTYRILELFVQAVGKAAFR
jgi:8-oxo-dGTP diphosphatase